MMDCMIVFSSKEMERLVVWLWKLLQLTTRSGKEQELPPIGRNTGLEYLKFGRTHAIEVELIWYFYRNSKSQLNIVLAEISGDLRTHAMDFFARSAQKLRSDELLQYGLALVRRWKPLDESVRLQLETDWRAGHPKINPLFEKLEADLREFATDADLPTENVRTYTSRLLYNFTRPEWAWENYRF